VTELYIHDSVNSHGLTGKPQFNSQLNKYQPYLVAESMEQPETHKAVEYRL